MIDVDAVPFPTDATLKKYGMERLDWLELYTRQHGNCAICHKEFKPGQRINVDHEHVKGWKHMQPEDRRHHVRGLLCYTCNKFMVMRGVTADKLFDAWQYMRRYQTRITAEALVAQSNSGKLHSRKKRVQRRDISDTDQQ